MSTFTFYHAQNGTIHGKQFTTSDDSLVAINTPDGYVPYNGILDPTKHMVDVATGAVIHTDTLDRAAIARRSKQRDAAIQLNALERSQARVLRESVLGYKGAKEKLQAIDNQIAALRPLLAK